MPDGDSGSAAGPGSPSSVFGGRGSGERMPTGDAVPEPPGDFWRQYLRDHRPHPAAVRQRVRSLNDEGRPQQVVALIEAALIEGQSQPWMYEILALSMEAAGRPKKDIQRVVLSLSDFGDATYDSVAQSARYLLSFDQDAAALRLLRQAVAMAPERPEAYLMAIPAVERSRDAKAAMWVLPGALDHLWGDDTRRTRTKAISLGRSLARRLERAGRVDEAAELTEAIERSAQPDLEVTLDWDGGADLDLFVTDPTGDVCSFEAPVTRGDGRLLQDGFGPGRTREVYVCPKGLSGTYEIRVASDGGLVAGGRATLRIVQRTDAGFGRSQKSVRVGKDGAVVAVELTAGRREQPRAVGDLSAAAPARVLLPRIRREGAVVRAGETPRGGAAVGTIIGSVSEGASLNAAAVVSGDRRYVRMGLSPWFSSLVGIDTFSFIGGGEGAGR